MKMLLTSVLIMIASSALAQTAPAASYAEHANHTAHASSETQPAVAGQGTHAGHSGTPAADPHAGHDMSAGMMDCCKKGADGSMGCRAKTEPGAKKMGCSDKPAPAAAGTDPHPDHGKNPK